MDPVTSNNPTSVSATIDFGNDEIRDNENKDPASSDALPVDGRDLDLVFHGSNPKDLPAPGIGLPRANIDLKSPSTQLLREVALGEEACHLDGHCILHSPPDTRPDVRTDIAFGDGQGTVAHVNELGELVCAIQLLDLGPSGLVQAKPNSSSNRDRHEDHLNSIIQGQSPGIGLRFIEPASEAEFASSRVDFVHDKWPRVSYTRQAISIQVQLAIVDSKIVQQYLLHNESDLDVNMELGFDLGVHLKSPYLKATGLNDTLEIQGGVFTTGPTGLVLAGGPGGYVQFSASLFDDGRAIPLSLREHFGRMPPSSDTSDSEKSDSENSDAKIDREKEDPPVRKNTRLLGLVHSLNVKVDVGQIRRITAIYHFQHGYWSRAQVYTMHLTTQSPDHDGNEEMGREIEFLNAYDNARSIGDFAQAKRIFERALAATGISAEVDKTEKPDSLVIESPKYSGQFSNWGGEEPYSLRLFGPEWQSSQRPREERDRFERVFGRRRRRFWHFNRMARDWRRRKPASDRDAQERQSSFATEFANLRETFRAENVSSYLDLDSFLSSSCPGKWLAPFSTDPSSFLFRRHLQHLLCVTSLPIRRKGDPHTAYFFSDGDLFGLQMESKTNLHQFRFLLYMHHLLRVGGFANKTLNASLVLKIVEVCKGHIEWCFDIAQTTTSGSWASQYRPFGSKCTETDDPIYGATNFLKLYDFGQAVPEMRIFIIEKMTKRLEGWLNQLKSSKNEKSGLWEGEKQEVQIEWVEENDSYTVEVPQYDLIYSLQIWEAIKAIDSIAEEARSVDSLATATSFQDLDALLEKVHFRNTFDFRLLQDLILDRFCFDHTFPTHEQLNMDAVQLSDTIKSQRPKQRLIAIARSGKQKPRFHWHTDSFNLCEGYDAGFFDTAISQPVVAQEHGQQVAGRLEEWKNTLELQRFQHEALWKKPSRYALALVLAKHTGISIDKTVDSAAMIRICNEALFGSILKDGKVAEQLHPLTKRPQSRMENLPEVVYGIPYYLLRTTHTMPMKTSAVALTSASSAKFGSPWSSPSHLRKNYKYEKSVRSIKKRGFYATVNEANIFESPCEPDWLFDDPNFFSKEDRPFDEEGIRNEVKGLKELVDDMDEENERYKVFSASIQQYQNNESAFGTDSSSDEYAAVVDVTKTNSSSAGIDCEEHLCYPKELLEVLRKKREKKVVKKRLVYVYSYSPRMALAVYLGAVGLERFFLPGFLTRHRRRGVFLRDETHKQANSWVTELHFGFYSVVEKPSKEPEDGDEEEEDEEEERTASDTIFLERAKPCPGREEWRIEKGAIGFHFLGDLNDKYWTSHVAVHLPRRTERWFADVTSFDLLKASGEGNKNTIHSQRKILEAQWFAKATKAVADETRCILDYAAKVSGEDDNGFYSSNKYDSFRQTFDQNKKEYVLYGDLIKFLYDVRESLRAIISVAKDWENRHASRETQPRWTRDDEAAYAEEILIWKRKSTTALRSIEVMEEAVEAKIDHIKQLRDWLLNDLNLKEARLSNRSADDVRIFTYATVIFLPLSFASSIFSMGGAPSRSTVISFATAATVALVATIIFVLNAGTPMRVIVRYRNKIFKLPQDDFVLEHADSSWRAVPRNLENWLVQYPSERVFTAREILKEKGAKVGGEDAPTRGGEGRRKSMTADEERKLHRLELKRKHRQHEDNVNLLIGVVLFPLFAFVYLVRLVFTNIFDLLKLLFYTLPRYPPLRSAAVEDDDKSIGTGSVVSLDRPGSRTAGKNKEKAGDGTGTVENIKQKNKRDLDNKESKYRQSRLKEFVAPPRILDAVQHLKEGNAIKEAMIARIEEIEGEKKELEKRRTVYFEALSHLHKAEATSKKKDPELKRENSEWKSEDEGTATRAESLNDGSHDANGEMRPDAEDDIKGGEGSLSIWKRVTLRLGLGLGSQGGGGGGDVEAGGTRRQQRPPEEILVPAPSRRESD